MKMFYQRNIGGNQLGNFWEESLHSIPLNGNKKFGCHLVTMKKGKWVTHGGTERQIPALWSWYNYWVHRQNMLIFWKKNCIFWLARSCLIEAEGNILCFSSYSVLTSGPKSGADMFPQWSLCPRGMGPVAIPFIKYLWFLNRGNYSSYPMRKKRSGQKFIEFQHNKHISQQSNIV